MALVSGIVATPSAARSSLSARRCCAPWPSGDLAQVERELDAPVGAGWERGVPAALRLKQLSADPAEQPWLVRAMVASTPRRVVGSIGFHAPPDERGRVEIGYDVVAAERRKGYAREAIHALLDWAWATGRVRTCVASVSPDNGPSLALIRPFGFPARRRADRRDRWPGVGVRAAPAPRDVSGGARTERWPVACLASTSHQHSGQEPFCRFEHGTR